MSKNIEEEKEKVRQFIKRYCEINGYKLNPDKKILEAVIEGLAINRVRKNFQYCPCRILSGNPQEDKLKICPCHWHKEEIEKEGHCHCFLFFKK